MEKEYRKAFWYLFVVVAFFCGLITACLAGWEWFTTGAIVGGLLCLALAIVVTWARMEWGQE